MAQHDPYRRQGGDYEEYGRRQRSEFDEDYDEMSSGSYGRESGRRQYGQYGQGGQGGQYGQYGQGAQGGAYRGRPEGQRGGASGMAGLGYGYGPGNEPGYGWREDLDQGRFQQRGRYGQGSPGGMHEEYGPRERRDPYTGFAMGGPPRYGEEGGWGREDAGQRQYFDPDYYQWRNEQMSALDDDYRNWRQDRYKKFSDEFSTWRSSRQKNQSSGGGDDGSRSGTSGASSTSGTGSSAGSSTSKGK